MKAKIALLGSGSWATALLKLLTHNHQDVSWWVRQQSAVDYVHKFHHNPKYLSSVEIKLAPEKIGTNAKKLIADVEYILVATPSAYFKDSLQGLTKEDFKGKHIISAIKGLIQPENISVSVYMHKEFDIPIGNFTNISGPCHAEEVAAEKLSYLTFASPDIDSARKISEFFKCRFLYTSVSEDLHGTEYASVLKNVYALACGISVGLGYGDNFRAVFVSKAMMEMEHFINTMHIMHRNLLEPAYLGDTMVTCYSQYSRNRTFGLMIGKGYTINAAILELNMVAEGYYATKSLHDIAVKNSIRMSILASIHHILYENMSAVVEFRVLAAELV